LPFGEVRGRRPLPSPRGSAGCAAPSSPIGRVGDFDKALKAACAAAGVRYSIVNEQGTAEAITTRSPRVSTPFMHGRTKGPTDRLGRPLDFLLFAWLRGLDLNQRPLGYEGAKWEQAQTRSSRPGTPVVLGPEDSSTGSQVPADYESPPPAARDDEPTPRPEPSISPAARRRAPPAP
jgi:hypothetical protein